MTDPLQPSHPRDSLVCHTDFSPVLAEHRCPPFCRQTHSPFFYTQHSESCFERWPLATGLLQIRCKTRHRCSDFLGYLLVLSLKYFILLVYVDILKIHAYYFKEMRNGNLNYRNLRGKWTHRDVAKCS